MSNNVAVIRSLIIYTICLPLAVFLGYIITDPFNKSTDITVAIILFLMVLPLLLRYYHAWLIAVWNMAIIIYFLPGQLPGWAPMAFLAFMVAVGHYILNRERRFLEAPSVAWSLVFLAVVVLVTAKFRGGFGLRVLGDETIGAKRYFYILLAILGYFALTSQAIPPQKRNFYAVLFVGAGVTSAISDIGGTLGGPFHFLFILFPSGNELVYSQNFSGTESVVRFAGFGGAGMALALTLVARYGIEGVLDLRKLWRPVLFFGAMVLMTLGGFRSMLVLVALTLAAVFWLEGLLRSRLMPIMVLGMILCGGLMLAFSDHLPLTFQRSIAFLPLKLDPVARMSAEASSKWRLEIWKSLLPRIPQYLLLGKGLAIDANDLGEYYQFGNQQVGGEVGGGLTAAGDYHSGPLTLIIPFGIWGVIAFLWFLVASCKVLWRNYKYGDPDARRINTFLLGYFIAKILLFFFVFGGFYSDIMLFAGIVGFNISLNGGVARPAPVPRPRIVFHRFRPLPLETPVPVG